LKDERFYALKLLSSAKTAIREAFIAISETTTSYVREALLKQFSENLRMHESAFNYTLSIGLTPLYSPESVIRNDFENARIALEMPVRELRLDKNDMVPSYNLKTQKPFQI
jgi:spore coat protein CotF